jgi:hypothetical protein
MPDKRAPVRIAWIVVVTASFCGILWLCWGIYFYWNDARLINFLAAWIPFVLSLLLAFIPESKMTRTKKYLWRGSVITVGLVWSVVLWRQQIIMDIATQQEQQRIVTSAVNQSNQHSDQQIGKIRSDVQGVKTDIQDIRKDVENRIDQSITKSTSTLNESIGKINKPIPPELARLRFSLYVQSATDSELPVLTRTINRDQNGNVPVDVYFTNISETAAESVDIWLYVCDLCSFVSDPPGFDRPQGINEHARHRFIPLLNPGTSFEKTTVLVKPSEQIAMFAVGFRYSCKVCGKITDYQVVKVSVLPALNLAK